MTKIGSPRICVVGLGYVGLPLAMEFGKHFPTVGFDISESRIAELQKGFDHTCEHSPEDISQSSLLHFTSNVEDIELASVYVIAVPTPIDGGRRPDLQVLRDATMLVGGVIQQDDVIIFESTVYPGVTEEICVPLLEQSSGLSFNEGFFVGYSPERVNPGDKERPLPSIIKITAGSTPETAKYVDNLYKTVISAGTYPVKSIKIAEAAKVIENTQRDLNIALVNELSLIFERLDLDTNEVLDAAATKWNFLNFRPGFVGGHCIGIDPFYLTHIAQEVGYHPEVILAGRRINDGMADHVAMRVLKMMATKSINVVKSKILILGFTFKENCSDIRNTQVRNLCLHLIGYKAKVEVFDPLIGDLSIEGVAFIEKPTLAAYDAIVLAVAHNQFKEMGGEEIRRFGKKDCVIFDVKGVLSPQESDGRL